MSFRAQGDRRLKPRRIARHRLWSVVLENACENHPGFQLRERHPDTHARSTSEGEVRSRRNLLTIFRVPTLGFEHLCILPDSRQAMYDPLTQDDQRSHRQAHPGQFGFFSNEAHLQPGRWIEAHRLAQNPIEVGKFGKVVKSWLATGEY